MQGEEGEIDSFVVSAGEENVRLDKMLMSHYPALHSRTYFQHLIDEGCVLVNGEGVKKRVVAKAGDEVEVTFLLTPEIDLTPEAIPLDILFEDEAILVVNKPPGLVVHPAPGHWSGTFVNALLYHCKTLETSGQPLRPGIVHRLDKETSGVLVAAKTAQAHQKLVELFSGRRVYKRYLAVCVGNPGAGEVNAPIGRHPKNRKLMAVTESGRPAQTRYETLAVSGQLSLVALELVTGRTHQVRVHMRHRGTPVLGDQTYGSDAANKQYGVERQMLHAQLLEFPHPTTGGLVRFEAAIPPDMMKWVGLFPSG